MYYKKISRRAKKAINKRKKEKEERRRYSEYTPTPRKYIDEDGYCHCGMESCLSCTSLS